MRNAYKAAACIMLAGMLATTVHADEKGGWDAYYDGGSRIESTFSQDQLNKILSDLQPGDSAELTVNLQNRYKENIDWWLRNEVFQSFEDSAKSAEGGAYSYTLTYYSPSNEEVVLYTSDAVGGDETEGLKEATEALKDEEYIHLGDTDPGKSAKVVLVVRLDGETQGNGYQDTLAKLDLQFAVEVNTTETVPPEPIRRKRIIPNTGDFTNMMPWMIACTASGIVILLIALYRLREEEE